MSPNCSYAVWMTGRRSDLTQNGDVDNMFSTKISAVACQPEPTRSRHNEKSTLHGNMTNIFFFLVYRTV